MIFVTLAVLLLVAWATPFHVRYSRDMIRREDGFKFFVAPCWITRQNRSQTKFLLSIGLKLFIVDMAFGGRRPIHWSNR